ncbi:MAG: transglutaminaseTgpA domain-containing protein [Armatimonadota bacterium]|nr:transglutaminaseTgpA domain-containing protein [Armatimonadota bacterium]
MVLERGGTVVATPPLLAYAAAWLLTLASLLAVQLARVTAFPATPFVVLLTLGVLFSAWLSRRPLSENVRFAFGFLDGAVALLCLIGQPLLNALFAIETDASVETYLSMSFLWYLCLRAALMVTMNALAFQSVPALALFGLIATYVLAAQVLWLFALMLLAMLFLMLASHRMEWGQPEALETGYALRTVSVMALVAGLTAFLLAPMLALTLGQLVSTLVSGVPLRTPLRTPNTTEVPPELQVGAGAVALSKLEVMRVRLEGAARPSYMRIESYNFYTGRGWNRGRFFLEEMVPVGQGVFVLPRNFEVSPQRRVTATVTVSNGWHRYLYSPGTPLKVIAPVRYLVYSRSLNSLASFRPLGAGESYTIEAYVPTDDPAVLRQAPPPTRRYSWQPFMRPPRSTQPRSSQQRAVELARALTQNQPTQYDKVMALMRYIEQNALYNLNVEPYPPEVDVVDYFLFEAKEGYCVEFATALAVLCLYADIPARVASGFILSETDPETGEYIVREEHRHLWTEVYFEGIGWVAFDATRNARAVGVDPTVAAENGEASQQQRRQWLQRLLNLLIGVVGLAMLYLLVAPQLGWTRVARQNRAQRLYARLVLLLRLSGVEPPAVGQTPRAYLEHALSVLQQRGSQASPILEALISQLNEYLYAAPAQSTTLEPEIVQQIRRIQRIILQELRMAQLVSYLVAIGRRKIYGN